MNEVAELRKQIVGLPRETLEEVKKNAYELRTETGKLYRAAKVSADAWQALVKQHRWWVTGNLVIKAGVWLATGTLPLLTLWLILWVSFNITVTNGNGWTTLRFVW